MKLIETTDYKAYLKHRITENADIRGYQTQMAKAAGCSKSFLSQVLAKDIDLTRDQAYGLCQFFHLFAAETDYFLLLVDMARASGSELKSYLQQKVKAAQHTLAGDLEKKVQSPSHKEPMMTAYYSDIHFGIIHMLLLIPGCSTAAALVKKINIPEDKVLFYLHQLKEMGLVKVTKNHWQALENENNLQRGSDLSVWHHVQWRLQSVQHIKGKDEKALHYSSAFTMSRKDYEKLKELVTEMLAECRRRALTSPSEEMYILNCDLYSY